MSQQGLRQAVYRTAHASAWTRDYNGDLIQWCNNSGITGTYNECLLKYLNLKMSTTIDNLPGAMAAFAILKGATNYGAIGTSAPA